MWILSFVFALSSTKDILSDLTNQLDAVKTTSHEEQALLKGCKWLLKFASDNKNTNQIFSDVLTMAEELQYNHNCKWLLNFSNLYTQHIVFNAIPYMSDIASKNISGKYDFISTLPALLKHSKQPEIWQNFYTNYFTTRENNKKSFANALVKQDFDKLGDLIIDQTFLHICYNEKIDKSFKLPPDNWQEHMREIESVDISGKEPDDESQSDKDYFVTHVFLSLNLYGRQKLPKTDFVDTLKSYILQHLARVQSGDDIDLLAEFIYCLNLVQLNDDEKDMLDKAVKVLLNAQNADGSWGKRDQDDDDMYDILHPTWTALTALVFSLPDAQHKDADAS